MKVLIYSEGKAKHQNIGWHRGGDNIQYYTNGLYLLYNEKKHDYNTLTFNYTVEYEDDEVYFANSVPYTYTDLNSYLNIFDKDEKKYKYYFQFIIVLF